MTFGTPPPTTTPETTTTTTPETTTTVPSTVPTTVVDTPTTTPPTVPASDNGGGLPVTGAQSLVLVGIALVLVATGAGFGNREPAQAPRELTHSPSDI